MIKIGIIGNKINYSVSPIIHNYWLEKFNINGIYNKLNVTEENFNTNLLLDYLNQGYIGFNITIPYKEKILNLVNKFDDIIYKINSANTVYYENNFLIADNTDCLGFILSLILLNKFNKKNEIYLNEVEIKKSLNIFNYNSNALVIGAGGAAKSVIYTLLNTNINKIYLINRNLKRLINIKKFFNNDKIIIIENLNILTNITLVVNCTPIENENPFDFKFVSQLEKNCLFYDLIYSPIKTNFLLNAELQGFRILNGVTMLIIQAAFSFKKWFKILPSIDNYLINLVTKSIFKYTSK